VYTTAHVQSASVVSRVQSQEAREASVPERACLPRVSGPRPAMTSVAQPGVLEQTPPMSPRRTVLVSLMAVTLTGGAAAGVAVAQRDDNCDDLRHIETREYDSFEEQQRVQAEALTACFQEEHEANVRG